MPNTAPKSPQPRNDFYRITVGVVRETDGFYPEYLILQKAVEAVNSFNSLYKTGRQGARGGPSTHAQQDLNRAMLIFACAGLDVLVKRLIKTKLSRLIDADKAASNKFKEYVHRGIGKNDKALLGTIALALVDQNPRQMFVQDYISSMTADSLQSVEELRRVSSAACLDDRIFSNERMNRLKSAFAVRNQIIHEMDIMVVDGVNRGTGNRTRRQRVSRDMERHTKEMLDLGQELFTAFRNRFAALKIDAEKARAPAGN